MLYDGDRVTTFARVPRVVGAAPRPRPAGLGVGADVNVSWQLPTWTESAVLVGALCRLGAVQNPMLPIYRALRSRSSPKQTRLQAARDAVGRGTTSTTARSPRQIAGENDGMHTLVADHWNPEGDPATLPAAPAVHDDPAADPVRWIFYTSGTTAAPKGAQHTDRSVLAGASATRTRRTWSKTTSRSRSRSRTWAASSSASTRRCSPARPRC